MLPAAASGKGGGDDDEDANQSYSMAADSAGAGTAPTAAAGGSGSTGAGVAVGEDDMALLDPNQELNFSEAAAAQAIFPRHRRGREVRARSRHQEELAQAVLPRALQTR